jgi:hypothetical protein
MFLRLCTCTGLASQRNSSADYFCCFCQADLRICCSGAGVEAVVLPESGFCLAAWAFTVFSNYIAQENVQAALAVVNRLEQRCRDAVANPHIGRKRPELQYGLRSLTEWDYVIFYRALGATVEILPGGKA